MEFKGFRDAVRLQFEKMCDGSARLFEVEVDKDEFWSLYLNSYPDGTNPIYRERTQHDCSCCRGFIKNIGNVVAIKGGEVSTIWDVNLGNSFYQVVADAMADYVRNKAVSGVYLSPFRKIGQEEDHELLPDGTVITYNHFCVQLPNMCLNTGRDTIGAAQGQFRDTRNVFKRSLDEITEESVMTVLELTAQKSLYKGEEWVPALTEFLKYKREYAALDTDRAKELYAWEKSITAGPVIGRIRNHSIGTLLVNISEDMDLDTAVKKYEQIVAPANYKRPNAIFTKKMLDDAKKTIEELGYMDSLQRRYATVDDITINNILFSNRDSAKRIAGADDVFAAMERETTSNARKFSKVEEIPIEKFVADVLPTVRELEVYLENKHASNMVSLIAPEVKDSKTMFKWNNGFSWAYTGNMTDSMMKERVKAAGGNVDGVLRFSIQWNDTDEYSRNDLDAHCFTPYGRRIFYANKNDRETGGWLDVDIINPTKEQPAVENIAWADKSRMIPGKYLFQVHCFSYRGGRDGFRAEIEFDGQIYSFDYTKALRQDERVPVAEVTLHKDGTFTIKELLPSTVSSKEVWNLKTNQFVPASVVMYSPNYWDEQQGIGHKHYFFMLKDCINPELPNGFYNEFLKQDLVQHKRVFEALGAKMQVKEVDDQLSGLGFSSTQRNELIVKVKGQTERILKIKF